MAKLPFQVEGIQTDNGSEFGASLHWHVLDKGIEHVRIKPRTPRLNGKVERSHRIDAEEFYRLLEGRSSTTPTSSTTSFRNGRTTTTTIDPTGLSTARRPTNASDRRPKTHCHDAFVSCTLSPRPAKALVSERFATLAGMGWTRLPDYLPDFVGRGSGAKRRSMTVAPV